MNVDGPGGISFQEMCELISEYWATKGINKSWMEIFEYSPTGELFMVFEWYEEAKKWKDKNEI